MNIARFEEGLKPEIQEKLIWMERPDKLSKMIKQAVKIDNNNRRTTNYRANDRRPAQPRNQGYSDPYGLQLMELDATHTALSNEERERRRKEKLCFRCGKLGHMSKDCKKNPRKGKQQEKKQMRATKELSAMIGRNGYDTTGTIKTKRSNERLRRLYKECMNLSDEEIEMELKKEDSTDHEGARDDWSAKDSNILAATNQELPNSNADNLID
ncbi:hypothetical protein LV159_008567 [Aspergillus fumigatus]|nr:hypothetical protein LV159_008567 [Aspergillus fumigatus]